MASYFDSSKSSKGWYARLEYNYTQSTSATTINLTLKVYDATGESYNNNIKSAYYTIQGTKTFKTYSFSSVGWYTIGSKTVTVSDTSATSLNVSAVWCSGQTDSSWTPYTLSVSGTITFPTIVKPVNPITVANIREDYSMYEGSSASLTANPSGGSSYTYRWYRDGVQIGTSKTLSLTNISRDLYDNTKVWCVVTESNTKVSAQTNDCWFHVGLISSLNTVTTNQIKSAKIKVGSKFIDSIPYIYSGSYWKYGKYSIK